VAADGQTLFIYRDDGGDGNIYESKLVGEVWSDPVLMGSDINTKAWETHGALTADGNTFYFVSDRKGGMGGRDIYRVVRLPERRRGARRRT
jgi:Tol biopolymer transport system component